MLWSIHPVLDQERRKFKADPEKEDLDYSIQPYQDQMTKPRTMRIRKTIENIQ